VLEECRAAGIELFGKETGAAEDSGGDSLDDNYARAFNLILQKHRPNFALLHLAWVDHTEHSKGPKSPEAYAAVKAADAQIQMVWDELQKDYPNRATLVVVSDHGFSPIKKMLLPNVVLVKEGLLDSTNKNSEGAVHMVVQGGSAFLYVRDQVKRDEVMAHIRKAFAGMEGVQKIAGPKDFKALGVADPKIDPHAPDLILFAEEGCVFGDTAAGALPFVDKPERKGSHGHDSSLPDLHATFVIWGAGIKPGVNLGEISNLDVAPTIAKLLGVNFPNVDGKPLKAVLSK
jgi:predicted AlkP superfamily pyrophosphatase or phosphodiesterase